jgi:tRNA A-37 threonylcarbamoyl transferase component Bud32
VELLRDRPGRRRLCRVRLPDGSSLFVKQHYAAGRRHPLRDHAKRALGLDGPRREWRNLVRLRRRGARVPEPRALGVLPNGDGVLAVDHLEGWPLERALVECRGPRTRLVLAVADLVAGLHAAGYAHWDLHRGNVVVTAQGPVLVDLQGARRLRSGFARRRDLGELDHSLATLLPRGQRVRLGARALGLRRPFGPVARRQLRAVGRASRRRARAQVASRTRRALRPGRRFARWECDGARGLRRREIDEASLAAALRAQRGPDGVPVGVAATAAGRVVVKEFRGGGWRGLLDLLRGSPARRAWRRGYARLAGRVPSATPLGFVERRRLGVPVSSTLVVDESADAGGAPAPDATGAVPGGIRPRR